MAKIILRYLGFVVPRKWNFGSGIKKESSQIWNREAQKIRFRVNVETVCEIQLIYFCLFHSALKYKYSFLSFLIYPPCAVVSVVLQYCPMLVNFHANNCPELHDLDLAAALPLHHTKSR
jgi:hypothetical protein